MKIERIRVGRTPELGEVDLTLQAGLVGWAGGTGRTRRLFADVLRWALGISESRHGAGGGPEARWGATPVPRLGRGVSSASHPAGSWGLEGGPGDARMDVSLGDDRVLLRADAGGAPDTGDGSPALRARLGLSAEGLALAWAGAGWTDPEPLWRAGARLLATRRGLLRLERALARLGASPGGHGSEHGASVATAEPTRSGEAGMDEAGAERRDPREVDPAVEVELAAVTLRLEELADVPERLRSLEEELRSLRADAAEVVGDLEVATMDWLRERQDAETHLQQYRNQARELRTRMREMEEKGAEGSCPFCGRSLGDHLGVVMAELQEEWDGLVQDGTWWRRRREQLDPKPEELQELERRSVRLQSKVEACAERLERCRFELREWDELRGRREELAALAGDVRATPFAGERPGVDEQGAGRSAGTGKDGVETPGAATDRGGSDGGPGAAERRRNTLLRAFREARADLLREEGRRLTRSAGSLLNRISGGRILGLVVDGSGRLDILEDGRVAGTVTVEDRATAAVALHLALALELVETGARLESILVAETFRGMDPEARIRSVEVLRGLRDRIPQILLLWGGEVVDAVPERFDQILEFRADRDRPSIRSLPGGVGWLDMVSRD